MPLRRRHATRRRLLAAGPSRRVRELVCTRDGWRCVVCGRSLLGRPYAIHPRRLGGTTPSELLLVCVGATGCRDWIGASAAEAIDHGYVLPEAADPADVPVVHAVHGVVYLLDDGGLRVPPEWEP